MAPNPNQKPLRANGKPKKKSHPANAFILYFQDQYKLYKGNMFRMARECAQQWRTLSQAEKDRYKRRYLINRIKYNQRQAQLAVNQALASAQQVPPILPTQVQAPPVQQSPPVRPALVQVPAGPVQQSPPVQPALVQVPAAPAQQGLPVQSSQPQIQKP